MDRKSHYWNSLALGAIILVCVLVSPAFAVAANCARLEVIVRSDSPQSQAAMAYIEKLQARWPGLAVEVKDILKDKTALARAQQLLKDYKIQKPGVPIFHAARQLIVGFRDEQTTGKQIESLLTMRIYTRDGCPHCANAKQFLANIKPQYRGFRFEVWEITHDANARSELEALARRHHVLATSVPTFYFCGEVIVGYFGEGTTGARLENLLKQASVVCPKDKQSSEFMPEGSARWTLQTIGFPNGENSEKESPPRANEANEFEEFSLEEVPLEELPPEGEEPAIATAPPEEAPKSIDLPIFGLVSTERIGLPFFTLAVGLVDGFNPCAMWVLLFLLSILVNLKDRRKILAVAGTFVVISGLAYFAFMAAWLNVFLFVGYLRPAQIILGVFAVFVGTVHIKDFISHGRGLSFSIPESAKPGIYARVRKIVTAEHLLGAVLGAVVLAVLVNVIELLCTAGLPALYTQILTMQDLPSWQNYAYLGLYNLAYMFDDSLMVAIVVITLGRRKLQERQGRWLKLVSGLVIVVLGLVLLFKPQWLI